MCAAATCAKQSQRTGWSAVQVERQLNLARSHKTDRENGYEN